jgi:hypothetical protein
MGGLQSELFAEYKSLLLDGLKAARKQQDRILNIVEIMQSSKSPQIAETFISKFLSLSLQTRLKIFAVFQKRLFCHSPQSSQSFPHESHRAGARTESRSAYSGLSELFVNQTLRWFSVSHQRNTLEFFHES